MHEDPHTDGHLRLVESPVEVCLDSAPENMVSAMALQAHVVLDSTWNGWARPVATEFAMNNFLARWEVNDPNGTWGHVFETAQYLVYVSPETDDEQRFPQVQVTSSGEPLYDLTGWMWVRL